MSDNRHYLALELLYPQGIVFPPKPEDFLTDEGRRLGYRYKLRLLSVKDFERGEITVVSDSLSRHNSRPVPLFILIRDWGGFSIQDWRFRYVRRSVDFIACRTGMGKSVAADQ